MLRAIKKKGEFFSLLLWRTEKQSMSQNYKEIDSSIRTKLFYTVELSEMKKTKLLCKEVNPSFLEVFK